MIESSHNAAYFILFLYDFYLRKIELCRVHFAVASHARDYVEEFSLNVIYICCMVNYHKRLNQTEIIMLLVKFYVIFSDLLIFTTIKYV